MRAELLGFAPILLVACGGGTPTTNPPSSPSVVASVAIQAGDGQTAAAGGMVAIAPAVIVKDQSGQPVSGVTVAFAIDSGAGSVGNATAVSGTNGIASSGHWTLGLGRNVLKATIAGLAPVRFGATGIAEVTVLDGNIGIGGGVLTVDHPGDPLNGMQITVPASAFTTGLQLKVYYGDQSGVPQRAGLRLVTKVMTIESNAAGYTSSAPMTFRIPATFSTNEWPIALLFNRQTGALEALPTVPIGTTAVVTMTRHINGDFLLPAAPGASIRSAGSLHASPVIQLVIGVVSYDQLAGDFDTGYRSDVDDWEFDHSFVMVPGDKSFYPGFPLAAAWYFSNYKSHGALNKQYQKAAGVEWSNPRGYKISALTSAAVDFDALNRYNASLEVFANPQGITLDSLVFLSVKAGMFATGRPQVITVHDEVADPTIASLVVYRTRGNALDVTLGTSASGIDAPRSLVLNQQHFAPLAWGTKDPETGEMFTTSLTRYGVTGATAGISFANMDLLWQQFFAGTIGDANFPKVQLVSRDYRPVKDTLFIPDDSTRVWLECATCTSGYPLTTTAFVPQGNIAGGIYYYTDASGKWLAANAIMKGNGLKASDVENLTHNGFEVVGFEPGKGAYYLDWIDFVVKTKRLTISPKPLNAAANTDYVLTATYDRPMPANPSWVWDLGDGRTITTPTATLTVNYPGDPLNPKRSLDIKVSLKSGTTLEATGHTTAEIDTPIYTAWKITSMTTALVNDTRGVDTRTAQQGNLWLGLVAGHDPASRYGFLWSTYQTDSTFLYTSQSTNAALALIARDTLLGPPFAPTTGFQRSIYWWTYGSFPTSAATPLSAGLKGSNNTLTRGGASCRPAYSARFSQTGTLSAGQVTGLNWVVSETTSGVTEPIVMFEYNIAFNGDIASGTVTKTYRIYPDCNGNPEVTWSYQTTLTATRIR